MARTHVSPATAASAGRPDGADAHALIDRIVLSRHYDYLMHHAPMPEEGGAVHVEAS